MDQMSKFAEWLAKNPWLTLSGFLITLLSFASALGFYLRSKRIKAPCYAIRSINLVKHMVSKIENLEMSYAGQRIENVTVSKVAFWNSGKDTIRDTDIALTDKIIVRCRGDKRILDARTIYFSNAANQFRLVAQPEGKSALLDFEFLEKDEGAVIQILHTGSSNDDLEFLGTIKGAGKPKKIRVPMLRRLEPFAGIRFFKNLSHRELAVTFALATFVSPIAIGVILLLSSRG